MSDADVKDPPRERSRDTVALRATIGYALVALIAFAPLAIGTVHAWTRALVFHVTGVVVLLTLLERRLTGKRLSVTMPLVALTLGVVCTLLQLVPLPADLVRKLSPAADDIFSTTLGAYRFHALSLDPAATLAEAAKLAAYAGFFAAACTFASRAPRRRMLLLAVVGVATLEALIGFAQALAHSDKILFFYLPHASWGTLVRGTFVNPNHFGGLMVLAAPVALAVGIRERGLRHVMLPAMLVINVAAVLSIARSTIISLAVGQLMVLVLDRLQLARGSDQIGARRAARMTFALLVVAAIAVAVAIGASRLRPEVAKTEDELSNPHSKIHAWRNATQLIIKYPWTGVGRGAFEQSFTQVDDRGGHNRFPWIENGYLQATTDWGVPAAILMLLLAGTAFVLAYQRLDDDPFAIGAIAAIAAIAVHEAADFSVELPGVALPSLAVLATLFGRRSSEASVGRRRFGVRTWMLVVPLIGSALAIANGSFPSAESEARALTLHVKAGSDTATIIGQGTTLTRRHPADFYIQLVVGEALARAHDPAALTWLNHAIYLNPTHPTPHMLAGGMLARAGHRQQALLEYRTAAAGAVDARDVWKIVVTQFPTIDDLLEATPETVGHRLLLAKWLNAQARAADADRVYQLVATQAPRNLQAQQHLAQYAVERGDRELARTRVAALSKLDRSHETLRIIARARLLDGDIAGADQILVELPRDRASLDLELALARAEVTRDPEVALARLDRVEKTWQLDRATLIALYETRAEIEQKSGNQHQYEWNLEQAARLKRP